MVEKFVCGEGINLHVSEVVDIMTDEWTTTGFLSIVRFVSTPLVLFPAFTRPRTFVCVARIAVRGLGSLNIPRMRSFIRHYEYGRATFLVPSGGSARDNAISLNYLRIIMTAEFTNSRRRVFRFVDFVFIFFFFLMPFEIFNKCTIDVRKQLS